MVVRRSESAVDVPVRFGEEGDTAFPGAEHVRRPATRESLVPGCAGPSHDRPANGRPAATHVLRPARQVRRTF